jgi:hypothetical protein
LEATDLIEVSTIESGSYVTRSITGQELIDAIPLPPTGLTIGTTPIASGTIGRVLFEGTGNVLQESANLFWDNTISGLQLQTENVSSSQRGLLVSQFNSGQQAPLISFQKARGTIATPADVTTGDLVGFFQFSARMGGAYTVDRASFGANAASVAGIGVFIIGGSSNGNYNPGLYVHPSNNVTIGSNQSILTGITDAGFKLDVNGTARVQGALTTTGAISAGGNLIGRTDWNQGIQPQGGTGEFRFLNSTGSGFFFTWFQNGVGAERMRLSANNNLLINTTTDAGFRLDVNGTARFVNNVTAGGYRVTTNGEGLTAVGAATGIISYGGNGAGSAYTFTLNNSYGGGNINRNFFSVGDNFYTSSGFASGTNTVNWLGVFPVINNTGGTTTIRGIYYNPTLTNLTGTTHYAFHSTSGRIRFENLPTSPVGLSSGDIWNNLGILTIV